MCAAAFAWTFVSDTANVSSMMNMPIELASGAPRCAVAVGIAPPAVPSVSRYPLTGAVFLAPVTETCSVASCTVGRRTSEVHVHAKLHRAIGQ
jgi:hypothetical protein